MRTLRTVLGLILVLVGVPALIAGTVGWTVLQHRDSPGAFAAPLDPVSTTGRLRVADGPLPVRATQLAGDAAPAAADTAFVLLRADGQAGIDATLSAALYPRWLNLATWSLLTAGTLLTLGGVVLLWPARRREVVLVVEANRVVELADRNASRVAGVPRNPARFGWLRGVRNNRRTFPVLARKPADAESVSGESIPAESAPAATESADAESADAGSADAGSADAGSAATAAVETAT